MDSERDDGEYLPGKRAKRDDRVNMTALRQAFSKLAQPLSALETDSEDQARLKAEIAAFEQAHVVQPNVSRAYALLARAYLYRGLALSHQEKGEIQEAARLNRESAAYKAEALEAAAKLGIKISTLQAL